MKKKYEEPKITFNLFHALDVVLLSGDEVVNDEWEDLN